MKHEAYSSSMVIEMDQTYNFSSPLWDRYFKRTRENVRFPRNYKEVSGLECFECNN